MVKAVRLRKELKDLGCIGLDTSVFIYHFEGGEYSGLSAVVFKEIVEGHCKAVVSTINIAEILVLPLRTGNAELADYYKSIFGGMPNLFVVDVDEQVAVGAAGLRSKYNTRMSDSLLLATALENGADAFITNEPKLKRVKELRVIVLGEYL